MESLSKVAADLSSFHWWITVVVVGIALNLFSSYLKPWIDRWYDTRSVDRKIKSEKERATIERSAIKLASNRQLIQLAIAQEMRFTQRATFTFVVSIFLLAMAVLVASIVLQLLGPERWKLLSLILPLLFMALLAQLLALRLIERARRVEGVLVATRKLMEPKEDAIGRGDA